MTRTISSVLLGLALALPGFVAPSVSVAADQGAIEQEIMQLERNWCSAVVKNDSQALNAILSDDLTDVSYKGNVGSRAQDLADAKTEKTTVCEADMMQVRIYGDVAVVVGRDTVKSTAFTGQARFTDTFVRRDGHWRCVSTQATEIKP